ncbi:MAG TPA: CRISPR-associated endonuclease Cas6 [bacterium]|nr:CRISPR-associated endonuclease Cas6 [bacterium]HOL35588.1 CRISPR-associated endonuclease Cas6 [bacterium]HPP08963.1 CRISPR-associated endonuclease Cas6 [bacterium]
MKVKTLIFHFTCDCPVKGTPDKLRGYFANRFTDYRLVHNHLGDNKFLYKVPLIQYKILKQKPFIIGINEGADVLQNIHQDIDLLKIGNVEYQIKEKTIVMRTDNFGITENNLCYFFLSPWLALNEENYKSYRNLKSMPEKREFLQKILVGNIISISKSIGYTVPEPIKATIEKIKQVRTTFKGIPMLGFLGSFSINFEIPDYWGIGKSVSRGFGTIKRCN